MHEKLISSILIIVLFNLFGCAGTKSLSVSELEQFDEKDKATNIIVETTDDREYRFFDSNYYVENDTLYGIDKQSNIKIALVGIRFIKIKYSGHWVVPVIAGVVFVASLILVYEASKIRSL